MKCPKCGSHKTNTYKHLNAKVWCTECDFVLQDEGATEYNEYFDKPVVCEHKNIEYVYKEDAFPYGDTINYFKCSDCEEIISKQVVDQGLPKVENEICPECGGSGSVVIGYSEIPPSVNKGTCFNCFGSGVIKVVKDEEKPELENVAPLKHISEEDMNIIVLTDEHLQKIITAAVKDGIKQYDDQKREYEVLRMIDCYRLSDGRIVSVSEAMEEARKEYGEEMGRKCDS